MNSAPSPRATVQEMLVGILRSPVGGLIARPWYDPLALGALSRLFFPLSRLWAAARAADGSVNAFFDAVPMKPDARAARSLGPRLTEFENVRADTFAHELLWDEAFFGSGAGTDRLGEIEEARLLHRNAYNNLRRQFLPIRFGRTVPSIRWKIPSPASVKASCGGLVDDEAAAFACPAPMPQVERSRDVVVNGERNYWLRFKSPDEAMDDQVYARVYEPAGVANPPTLIFGHGICVEFDHWRGMVDEVHAMTELGIRVIRPEAPWHGRRVPPGNYGGERIIATTPLGGLQHFIAAVREWAVLIDWARHDSDAPVAIGGSSLGSMTAQLVAERARHWPERLWPDAMFLVTHCGQFQEAVRDGSLGEEWRVGEAAESAGWSVEEADRYTSLLSLGERPVVAADMIVSVLGSADTVTPFAGAERYIARWGIPSENVFVSHQGHFSLPVGMMRDKRALTRFAEVLRILQQGRPNGHVSSVGEAGRTAIP